MLSPHEFATLLLVGDAWDQTELNRADLDALLEQQFIAFDGVSGRQNLYLTQNGRAVLKAVTRIRQMTDLQRRRNHDLRSWMPQDTKDGPANPRSQEKAIPV